MEGWRAWGLMWYEADKGRGGVWGHGWGVAISPRLIVNGFVESQLVLLCLDWGG